MVNFDASEPGEPMESDAYTLMAAHEANHWWFVGRRAVIDAVLDRQGLPQDARILEAGCGTGGNLYLLQGRGSVYAFEPSAVAIDIARERHPGVTIAEGELPGFLPFAEGTFDLVAALDVLEHVEDDRASLAALVRQARPGGRILVSVPTHPILFGSHDRRLHHVRRYGVGELRTLVDSTGCTVEYFGAYNTILAPLAFGLRLAERVMPLDFGNQERLPAPGVNRILTSLFALEGPIIRRGRALPFGLSHVALLRRPE
jgi:SAM-dependent methyltransferase